MPGAVLAHPGARTIGDAEHVWLAWLTHNVSDIHGNRDAAERTDWGQPIVLGVLVAAIVIGLAAPAAGPPASGLPHLSDGWRAIGLHHPVMAGDTIRAESRFEAATASAVAPSGRVHRTISGLDQHGELVVSVVEERSVLRRLKAR